MLRASVRRWKQSNAARSVTDAPSPETFDEEGDPIVAVVIPAKDAANFLRPCLSSILEQRFPLFECVIVDDGSTDDTAAIAQQFAAEHRQFRLISNPSTLGPSAARNAGIAASSAPYVTFLDADDFLYADSIRARVQALELVDGELFAGTFCDWQPTAKDQGPVPPDRAPMKRVQRLGFIQGPECPFIVTAPLVRRSVLEEVGGFDESMSTAEDFDLWIRILRAGYMFSYVPMIGVAYRQKTDGLVFSASARHAQASSEVMRRQYEDVSAQNQAPLLSQPLPHYQLQCAVAERLLRTYSLAAANKKHEDVELIQQNIPVDLTALRRAGLNVEGALYAGVERASHAIPELATQEARHELVRQLVEQLDQRSSSPHYTTDLSKSEF